MQALRLEAITNRAINFFFFSSNSKNLIEGTVYK